MINKKTPRELRVMEEGGAITGRVLKTVLESVRPGVTLAELNKQADHLLISSGAEASFKMVRGYDYATCINVNDGVVHGLPDDKKIVPGDLVSVDLGAYYKGYHTDAAATVIAGGSDSNIESKKHFLEVGRQALERAIEVFRQGNTLGDISSAIQETIEGASFTVSQDLVGHGVGRDLHEEPQVPGYFDASCASIPLETGLVLAIEIIYYESGGPIVVDKKDQWTIRTEDGSIAALFEHSVALNESGPVVLTKYD